MNTPHTAAKLCDVEGNNARVCYKDQTGQHSTWVPIKIPEYTEDLFYETWHYGDTAILNSKKELIDWSYLSIWNKTLQETGVDVNE